ncbi:TRAP transporter small permease [Alloyangia pacifica]|uniref:TRAP transporter small permease n=1 Tax=Alloyangia pacifica TaxID=311180 RepID=UPI001CFDE8C2|nr:TRAP transporter small permease [Alloyangia pacifica]
MSIRSLISGVIATWALAGGLVLLVIVLATAVNAAGFTADMIAGLWGGDVPGLSGYEDGVTMLIGVAALAMFPYCQLHGGHAAVDIFMDKAPDWARRGVEILSGLLVTALALTMAVMLIYGTIETRSDNVETAVLGWPVWVFMPTAVLSCLLWAIAALMETFGQEVSHAQ